MIKLAAFFILFAVASCISVASAENCIRSTAELATLQSQRGANNSIPVTYVFCPNTIFDLTGQPFLELNGNTNYFCGVDGSSKNNCIFTGGEIQFIIDLFSFDFSSKDKILLSGLTFEKGQISSATIATSGSFVIRDCIFKVRDVECNLLSITSMSFEKRTDLWRLLFFEYLYFKDNINHSVLALVFYLPPTLRRRSRVLGLPSKRDENFDYRKDFMNYLKDPELQKQRMNDRSLLVGGGSEPRLTLLLDGVQFLNNTLTSNLTIPSIASNGPLDIFTAFADVTVSKCLFKDNNYPYSREIFVSILFDGH
jgi:hypothetical protein